MDVPSNYKNQHLRFQVIMYMIDHAEELLPLVKDQLAGIYGEPVDPAEAGAHTGPFSYCSYLNFMLNDVAWGDQVFLMCAACMWDLKITILNGEELNEIRLRHNLALSRAVDIVLVHNGHSHYSKASKFYFLT
jgi:hypothetical protein